MQNFRKIKESLPFKNVASISCVMDSDRFKVKWIQPNAVTVGWISDDPYPTDPLLDQDGFGRVYTARHADAQDLNEALQNPDRVLLDCYEHGGQVWSISGCGQQCSWDTSRAAGVWVPDDCAESELDRREKVYAFGSVTYAYRNGRKVWQAELDSAFQIYAGVHISAGTDTWYEAFQWLEQVITSQRLKLTGSRKKRELHIKTIGRARAREELAREALALYNEYLAGNVYGTAVATFQLEEPGYWAVADAETVWDYIGIENAYQAMDELFEGICSDFVPMIDPIVWQQVGPTFGHGAGI